jgi:hypothetical protein
MGMIRSSITVIAADQWSEGAVAEEEPTLEPVPAGVSIPVDGAAIAEAPGENGFQTVTINLRDEGFSPAILVVQRDIPVAWIINNDSLDPGNGVLIVPAYYAVLELDQGDNGIQFMPSGDFDFSTGDNIFYGYVKVVDDINKVDMDAIKAEVGEFETLIYPDAWFEQVSQGGGCCQ